MTDADLIEQAYRVLRFEQHSEQEILDALVAIGDVGHNSAITVVQAFLRKQAIGYAAQGKEDIFTALEECAAALDSLMKDLAHDPEGISGVAQHQGC